MHNLLFRSNMECGGVGVQEDVAPECVVVGCRRLAALTDVATSRHWRYLAHYCAECYARLLEGVELEMELTRIVVERRRDKPRPVPLRNEDEGRH
jgi:hypothetical protein